MIGNRHDAQRAVWGWRIDCPCGCDATDGALLLAGADDGDLRLSKRLVGQGESRAVWLINGVVYKVATRDSANVGEHQGLTEWRKAGARWAPETSLHEARSEYGEAVTVLAMPWLPDDGGQIDAATLADIKRAAPQTCRENYVAHGGLTYLIDGGDIEISPASQR